MQWTHPQCDECWSTENPIVEPFRLREEHRETETCCTCGTSTRSGIYIRRHPDTILFPAKERE